MAALRILPAEAHPLDLRVGLPEPWRYIVIRVGFGGESEERFDKEWEKVRVLNKPRRDKLKRD
jgi:hypothetical protein